MKKNSLTIFTRVKNCLAVIACVYCEVELLSHRGGQCSYSKDTATVLQSGYINLPLHKLRVRFQAAHLLNNTWYFEFCKWPS